MVLKFGNCCENWSFHTGAQTRKLALFFLCMYITMGCIVSLICPKDRIVAFYLIQRNLNNT